LVAAFAIVWFGLNGLDAGSWIVGGPTIVLAAYAARSLANGRGARVSLPGLVAFAGYFFVTSVRGGVDIAKRALAVTPEVDGSFFDFPVSLPGGPAKSMFCSTISLLPGTLVAGIDDTTIRVHSIGSQDEARRELQHLERRTAALFGLDSFEKAAGGRV
jgi:multicomponent Na+:H+ antiporter subunit E